MWTFLQPHATGLWHSGQKLYLRISFSTAQCLHTLHIQNWYSWMGRPVTMHMGNFPSELKDTTRKRRKRSESPWRRKKSLSPDSVCHWTHPSEDLLRSSVRPSLGGWRVKISRARSSYSCCCPASRLSRDSSLMKACEHVPNARLTAAQRASRE